MFKLASVARAISAALSYGLFTASSNTMIIFSQRVSAGMATQMSVQKKSLKTKFLGGISLGHQGPRRRDIPDKDFVQVAFFCYFRQGSSGRDVPGDLGRDVPDLENPYARKLWADFLFPIMTPIADCIPQQQQHSGKVVFRW